MTSEVDSDTMIYLFQNLIFVALTAMMVLAVLLFTHQLEKNATRHMGQRFGYGSVLLLGAPGIVSRGVVRWLMAKLAGHRIFAISFFSPNPAEGTLGYVRHAHQYPSLRQRSAYPFIDMAPLVLAVGGFWGLIYLLTQQSNWMAFTPHYTSGGHLLKDAETLAAATLSLGRELFSYHRAYDSWLLLAIALPALSFMAFATPVLSKMRNIIFLGVMMAGGALLLNYLHLPLLPIASMLLLYCVIVLAAALFFWTIARTAAAISRLGS